MPDDENLTNYKRNFQFEPFGQFRMADEDQKMTFYGLDDIHDLIPDFRKEDQTRLPIFEP